MLQGREVASTPEFWEAFRSTGAEMLTGGDFAKVPAVLREGLLFPYLAGGEFMRWWLTSPLRDTFPWGPRLPSSTEQILFPDRYVAGDRPFDVRFTDVVPGAFEDVLGEFETRLLVQELTGRPATNVVPLGWGGDRFRLAGDAGAESLVWVIVFDEPYQRGRFREGTGAKLLARQRAGYRALLDELTVSGRPGLRFVLAPVGWDRWERLPTAEVRSPSVAR
jgi:hypothetical protein